MKQEKFLLTQEGVEQLRKEKERLINIVRPEVIEELQAARAQGDLSENADYDAARDRQAAVEARINELDNMLANAQIIYEKAGSSKVVRLGATVTIMDLSTEEVEKYSIVGSVEADPLNGKVSNVSPLGQAILDRQVGDVVSVMAEEPYEVKIVNIERT